MHLALKYVLTHYSILLLCNPGRVKVGWEEVVNYYFRLTH